MMCCSCQGLQGCVPVAPSRTSCASASSNSCRAPLDDESGRLGERLAAPGPHLDLRRDELAHEMLLERRAARRGLQLLEVGRERERLGVEEGELLLDGEREVLALVERRACAREQLPPGLLLRFTH